MRKGLLISTMLVSVFGLGASAEASNQCLQTPSCESLGYTQTSCVDNNGVKCPFGNKYFCVCPAKYAYSCSGTGYAGGSGTACGGKYTECTCASGYEWKDGSCSQGGCKIGDIFYSDKTCSSDVVSGKTPIAVVVYIDGNGGGQAMALNSIGQYTWSCTWGECGTDVPSLPNYLSNSLASQDFASCENSQIIMAAGDKSTYPAVWAANEYNTEGTSFGNWCLPAAGIFTSYYNNQEKINAGFDKVGGTKFTTSTWVWSSSEYYGGNAWYSYFINSYGLEHGNNYSSNKYQSYEVRPVIEFPLKNSGTPSCDSSYKYTCTGTGYSGGSGVACNGKYKACTCSSGYSWENGSCVKQCDDYCRSYNGYCPNGTLEPNGTDGCGNTCYQCCVPYEDVTTDVYCFYGDTISTITSHCENYSTDDKGKYKLATPYKRIKNGETTIHKHCRLSYKTLSECEQASESYKDRIGVSNTKKHCY